MANKRQKKKQAKKELINKLQKLDVEAINNAFVAIGLAAKQVGAYFADLIEQNKTYIAEHLNGYPEDVEVR